MEPLIFRFSIDRGGTFTDLFAQLPDGSTRVLKLLSVDPSHYVDAPREGIRRVLEDFLGVPLPRDAPLPTDCIGGRRVSLLVRCGTTVATNALLERKGARTAFVGEHPRLLAGPWPRPRPFANVAL